MFHHRMPVFFMRPSDFSAVQLVSNDLSEFYLEKTEGRVFLICREFPGSNEESFFEIESSFEIERLIRFQIPIWYDRGCLVWDDTGSETEEDDFEVRQSQVVLFEKVEDLECPVCYEDFKTNVGSLCGHAVCKECMVKMYENKLHDCPMCRSTDFKFPIRLAKASAAIIA